jgi:hypothetical protein
MKKISGTFLLHIATAFTTQERSRSPVFHYIPLQHPTLDTAPDPNSGIWLLPDPVKKCKVPN